MDFCDEAAARSAQADEAAIAAVRGALAGEGCDHCIDCDAVIPPARRAAMPSASRCVDCQELAERAERGL